MVSQTDYNAKAVEAARAVLIELAHLMGDYRNEMILVGGWVPELLLPQISDKHIGSIDVDLALDHRSLEEEGYRTLKALLMSRAYREAEQPFSFYRSVPLDGVEYTVRVDFLAGEYGGTGKKHRTQPVQDIRARKARGCDLAFQLYCEVKVEGVLPGGGQDSAIIRVASIVPFLVMKGMALYDRMKEKDAWDIYYCLKNYPGGLDELVRQFEPHMDNRLVQEGLQKIAEKFASVNHVGPIFVADFSEITDEEMRAAIQRDAYERTEYLLKQLNSIT